MKKITLKTLISSGLAASLATFAIACGDEDNTNHGGTTVGTGCKAFICDADGTVRQGALGELDEYAASSGCSYKAIGTCIDGCDATRDIERLPGCDVGNACNVQPRNLPPPVNISALTSCKKETTSDTESCEGYPCLSRLHSGMPKAPFACAVKQCNSNSDCADDEFCRCSQTEVAAGAFTSERWCVKKFDETTQSTASTEPDDSTPVDEPSDA